jgi:hypothetical protein
MQVRDALRGATLDTLLEAHPKTRQVSPNCWQVTCTSVRTAQGASTHIAIARELLKAAF